MKLSDRILRKTHFVPESGCWIFTGSWLVDGGHGQAKENGKCLKVHRVSWEIHNGPIPAGMCVCHKCDTPACWNPAHLFLGTQLENIADMKSKGRRAKKLTIEQVREIRSINGVMQKDIAESYGVSRSMICKILSNKVRN